MTASTDAPVVSHPQVQIWHSIPLLIGIGAFSVLAAIAVGIGGARFPANAPVEQLYAIGLIIDLAAVAILMVIFIAAEVGRRRDPLRQGLPQDTSRSALAITALVLAGVTVVAWVIDGGFGQLIDLAQGIRGRYMFHTGGVFLAGAPWALSFIFGAWGFRPGGHRLSNVFALVAIGIAAVLGVIVAAASLIYGADLSD